MKPLVSTVYSFYGANCFVLNFSESVSVLLSLVKGIRERGQVRIAP